MSARDTLTPELRAEVLRLEDDLRARVASLPDVQSAWREEYDAARAAERTAAAWEAWVDERVTLAAVAWVLTTVFVRFCEDNGLVKPVWISGPRIREAIDAQQQFLRETARTNADVTDREWLLQAVEHLRSLPATEGLVDDTSPMWLVTPSGDAATRLINFWRERNENGALVRDLSNPDLDTRFLGDLYQDISEDAKRRYALLQTPVFVEEFILDRTLEPALEERPLEGFKMIDPTCGSGHFLLSGFQRLLDRWHKHAPGIDERERVQSALDSVYGVDLNPFAVAITRFRLTVAAIQACGLAGLADAPAFKYHLAAGDSLLHGLDQGEFDLGAGFSADKVASSFAYETENLGALQSILRNEQYDVVVGNPPYITPKDEALNRLYRERYASCHRQYALTVPFMERFYRLAKAGHGSGWTGQITSNSFMKREFGSKLIEKFLPTKDLRLVVDTSGAYIPGHGTPTVIIVGRNQRPQTSVVRGVLGVRGEPGRPEDPAQGYVWSSVVANVDNVGWNDEWISVVELDRARLESHPWSLTGGGAVDVAEAIDRSSKRNLSDLVVEVGRTTHTGGDEGFYLATSSVKTLGLVEEAVPVVLGEGVRDYAIRTDLSTVFPYDDLGRPRAIGAAATRWFWPNRTVLRTSLDFGQTREQRGLRWFDHSMFFSRRYSAALSISWAGVATHNHFALNRDRRVFNRWADTLIFSESFAESDYQAALGVLNSSTACFWMKQNSHDKGVGGIGGGIGDERWEPRYEFTGTTMKDFPLPVDMPAERGALIDRLAVSISACSPAEAVNAAAPTRASLGLAKNAYAALRSEIIAQQEELDWEVYRLYGFVEEDMTYRGHDLPGLALGERAFEIVLARRFEAGIEQTAWFERHGSTPITEIPDHWPVAYRDLVSRRIELIESHPFMRILEKAEYKRRWQSEPWEKSEERALRGWLLDRLEDRNFWLDARGRPTPKSIAVLADEVARDGELAGVLKLWEGRPDVDVAASLKKLLGAEGVPFLAAYRYRDSGLRKRQAWEHVWELQRREDAGTYSPAPKEREGDGPIPVPPKYTSADFRRTEYWSYRGKLDVPKEQFIVYTGAGREGDPTPVLGWAGWDHSQQALALATLIQSGEQQGWSGDRLIPLVAGLSELLPWVEQWHNEPDALYGGSSPAEFFSGLLDSYMAKLGATRESLAAWRPPAPTRGRKGKS